MRGKKDFEGHLQSVCAFDMKAGYEKLKLFVSVV